MQIPKQLPQFADEKALFIVSGRLGMEFYLANSGKIKKLQSFHFPKPSKLYTDNEGFFLRSSGGGKNPGVTISGSVREPKKQRLRQELYRKLRKHLENILKKENITRIYLFAPDYLHKEIKTIIKDNLSNKLKKQIRMVIEGNYLKSSPLTLIRKIKAKRQKKIRKKIPEPMSKAARKLYKKAIKATKVIKGKPDKSNPYRKINN